MKSKLLLIASFCLFMLSACRKDETGSFALDQTVYVGSDDGNLYAINGDDGSLDWSFKTGGSIISSPTLADSVVYVGSFDSSFYAINAVTGQKKWVFKTAGPVESSPIVSSGVVYVGSDDGYLYAINAATGIEKWRFKGGDRVVGSPTIDKGIVYVYSQFKDGQWNYSVYAVDAALGTQKWRNMSTSTYSNPAVANDIIYYGSSSTLFANDAATGNFMWVFGTKPFSSLSGPVVYNGVVYVANDSLYTVNAKGGDRIWAMEKGSAGYSSPFISNGMVYIASNQGVLYAATADKGIKKWQLKAGFEISSPTVANGVLFIGSMDNNLYAIDAITGRVRWKFKTEGWVRSSPCVLAKDGQVYHSSISGY